MIEIEHFNYQLPSHSFLWSFVKGLEHVCCTFLSHYRMLVACISSQSPHLATPLHWIYDQSKVADLAAKVADGPEFYPTSHCPFYTMDAGSTSVYGDQLCLTLRCIAENRGMRNDLPAAHLEGRFEGHIKLLL